MLDAKEYWTLFKSTFTLSAFSFGGGYSIVPLMQEQFVDKLHWIDEDEMLDLVALGQSAPGPIAVNTAILIGYQKDGVLGALVSTLGTILPPLVIMTLISYIYFFIRDNALINNILMGMAGGIAAIIVNAVYNMAKQIVVRRNLVQIIVMVLALAAAVIFQINIIYILILAASVGLITSLVKGKGGQAWSTGNF